MRSPAPRSLDPRATLAALAALSIGALAAGAGAAPNQEPDGIEVVPKGFSIPDTRQARALADRAAEHIAARRYAEAIADLQELIVAHQGAVLRDPRASDAGAVHVGAAQWARAQLHDLPQSARNSYRDRFEVDARDALERARRARSRRELIEVAQRYPLCDAARDVWWTLGDLELEQGDAASAQRAYARARELENTLGLTASDAARARIELATALRDPPPPPLSPPGSTCHCWQRRIEGSGGPHKSTPFESRWGESYNLLPYAAGDLVLFSDTLRLHAFDALSGEPRWTSAEAPGWDAVDAGRFRPDGTTPIRRPEFFDAVDRNALVVQPAAGAGVAVAALQIPVSHVYKTDFQNYPITSIIPDRRLFAYELATGRELWNHMPLPTWDGESGSFVERMRVAAPPLIAGTRVIVPVYRMQGRVELHVACFDLGSGELLWSTALVSGQLELNMFGRQSREFSAAPLVLAQDRVIALTQLGAVAALDLESGEILWETLYDQIELPRNEGFHDHTRRAQYWRNCAPAVAGDVVVASPIDSEQLIGIDLRTGKLLWSRRYSDYAKLRSSDPRLALLGAADDGVWIAGRKIVAARPLAGPGGLASAAGPSPFAESADLAETSGPRPLPVLTAAHVIVPTPQRRIALARTALSQPDARNSSDWGPDASQGNAIAADGALYFASNRYLTGCVDWTQLERRLRERCATEAGNPSAALELARTLALRAEVALRGSRAREATTALDEALAALGKFAATRDRGVRSELDLELSALEHAAGRAALALADSAGALAHFERSAALAPDAPSAVRALVGRVEVLEERGGGPLWLAALDELEARGSDQPMPEAWWREKGAERFAGVLASGERPSVGLWVTIQRALAYAASGDVARELEALHELVRSHDDARVPTVLSEPLEDASAPQRALPARASEWISRVLAREGRAPYAPFEAQARALLDEARAARDPRGFERVMRWYPHSEAAIEAGSERLRAAIEAGDSPSAVELAERRIPDSWSPARARPDEVEALLALRAALEDVGNRELARALLAKLARAQPSVVSPLARDRGASVAELEAALPPAPEPIPIEERSAFDARSNVATSLRGAYLALGTCEVERAGGEIVPIALYGRRDLAQDLVVAFDAAAPARALWSAVVGRGGLAAERRAGLAGGSIVVSSPTSVHALDPASGEVRWRLAPNAEQVLSVACDGGTAVLALRDATGSHRLLALDGAAGIELWTRALPAAARSTPIVGGGRIVLVAGDTSPARATVLDLFTGAEELAFEIPAQVGDADVAGAWIAGTRLVLPLFPKRSGPAPDVECALGFDLESGRRAWRVGADEEREFDSVLRHGDDAYLVFLPASRPGTAVGGSVLELDSKIGAVRRLQNVTLAADDVLAGVPRHAVTQLHGPWLVVRSVAPGGRETLLRGIHLPFGQRWEHRLRIAPAQFYNGGPMPLPAISQSTLAIAYSEWMRTGAPVQSQTTTLLLFDRNNGVLRESSELPRELGPAEGFELETLGGALWIAGRDALHVRGRP